MSFANPLLLIGLLGAAVPIIIHLIHKRKPRKQAFAAIELLLKSIERVERRWRIKRFLLLAARVTLLAALALAAAGPLIGSEKILSVASSGPKRLGIVVDASLSMRAKYGRTSAWTKAIAEARGLVDAMGPEDQAVIVAARQKPTLVVPRPTGAKSELLAALDRLEPSFGRADMGEAVTMAAQALASLKEGPNGEPTEAEANEPGRGPAIEAKVVVLSDLAGHAFQTAADLALGTSGKQAELEVIDVLANDVPRDKRENRGVVSVESANVPGRAPRTMEFRARVQSFTAEKGDTKAAGIALDGPSGSLEQASVDVVPGTIVDKTLRHAFEEAGFVPVRVTLEPDVLADDDVRYAVADVRRQVRTLVVDGAPSGVPKEDEIFYLERALAAGAADQPAPRVVTADDLTHTDLGSYDVVILAGVNAFARTDGGRLAEFVEKGGGLLITASTDIDVDLYNTELGRVLPRQLRAMKVVDPQTGGLGADGLVTLRAPALDHPVMEVFDNQTLGGLLSAKTRAYLLLEPGGRRPVKTLVEYEDGQPALVLGEAGQGKVAILTTSIDRDLTDLPIRPAFLPLMRRLLLELGGALSKPDPRNTLVADARAIRVPPRATKLLVTAPDGKETEWTAGELAQTTEVQFDHTELPGHYAVKAQTTGALEPLAGEEFAVNVDPRESDLRALTTEEAMAVLTGSAEPSGKQADTSALTKARALKGLTSPDALAGVLLLLMGLAFLVESALTAQRIGR